jgi:hypothetical protein
MMTSPLNKQEIESSDPRKLECNPALHASSLNHTSHVGFNVLLDMSITKKNVVRCEACDYMVKENIDHVTIFLGIRVSLDKGF